MKSWLEQAREESGLTVSQCAVAIRQPVEVYMQIEKRPGTISLNELRALCRLFSSPAQQHVRYAVIDAIM
ncbi:hypothetical protein ET524_10205 [Senegalimassilia faecalis]|uniref:XRE family transcriptional regulator n=1 Tax=Senegalimassilia faecalis TaxID=2509433 RepID=A0A4Q2K093_9ACTN|nr:hypothetical protein [Senegalimassilia faecalis]RXZ54809.1 hypothetical protein ET524_10205 [Senegalimassilia faecalis]